MGPENLSVSVPSDPLSPTLLMTANNSFARSEATMGTRILVADTDVHLATFLKRELEHRGYLVDICHDGEDGHHGLLQSPYDLAILDMNLLRMDGSTILKQLRQRSLQMPILAFSARNCTEDLILAFEHGADDCLRKPFSFRELLARIRRLLTRNCVLAQRTAGEEKLTINAQERWARRGDRRIELTDREFSLLDYLAKNVGKTVTRKDLMEKAWNIPYDASTNNVNVYMKYLRDKVDREGEPKLIRTVRGVGYALVAF